MISWKKGFYKSWNYWDSHSIPIMLCGRSFCSFIFTCLKGVKLLPSGRYICLDVLGTILWMTILLALFFAHALIYGETEGGAEAVTNSTMTTAIQNGSRPVPISQATNISRTIQELSPCVRSVLLVPGKHSFWNDLESSRMKMAKSSNKS